MPSGRHPGGATQVAMGTAPPDLLSHPKSSIQTDRTLLTINRQETLINATHLRPR